MDGWMDRESPMSMLRLSFWNNYGGSGWVLLRPGGWKIGTQGVLGQLDRLDLIRSDPIFLFILRYSRTDEQQCFCVIAILYLYISPPSPYKYCTIFFTHVYLSKGYLLIKYRYLNRFGSVQKNSSTLPDGDPLRCHILLTWLAMQLSNTHPSFPCRDDAHVDR